MGGGCVQGGFLAGEPRLAAPLIPNADLAGAVGPLQAEEEIVITVTEASDDEIEDAGQRVNDSFRIECRFDSEASEMSARVAAITRSRGPSREATPAHSRAVSRVPSCEELDEGRVIINPVQEALHNHPLSTSPDPSHRTSQRNPNHHWGGSSSNLTSTDSTPSSDTAGPATDSPLTGNINSLGFPPIAGDASPCQYRMPIVGYEVLEERARFTVFKIQVFHQPTGEHWFVFRRYTDFVRLNKALKKEFPGLRFALPPKRWFGDNFDPIFLEDRQLGLQAFIDNIVGHSVIRGKKCVRDFFCLDDPLGTHDTLEESRAMCQTLEETVSDLQDRLREKEGELAVLRSQVNFLLVQQQTLVKALRLECDLKSPVAPERGSTHDLNLSLLNICERTLDGSFINANRGATVRNGASGTAGETSPGRRGRVHSTVESPLRRTLEKAFLPRSCSHNTLSLGQNGATAVNGTRAATALIVTEGEDGASR